MNKCAVVKQNMDNVSRMMWQIRILRFCERKLKRCVIILRSKLHTKEAVVKPICLHHAIYYATE